ncbi:hypothetical protein JCM16303_003276 [Sporobolomyces ruberrimus]
MGNNASIPLEPTSFDLVPSQERSKIKKSSLPSLPTSNNAAATAAAWRRASEPTDLPRRKSLLRRGNPRRSDDERRRLEGELRREEIPRLVIGEESAGVEARTSQDSYEASMIRVGGRKFSRAEPVDTEDALAVLERITRAASFSSPTPPETGLGLMTKGTSKGDQPPVPFSFDLNYRLDSPSQDQTFTPASPHGRFPRSPQVELSPFESPVPRFPLSPVSHWSDSSACGLTPPPTFQSFRNSVNLAKTINRYSNLLTSSDDSTSSPQDSVVELPVVNSPTRSKLSNRWRKQISNKKGKGKSSRLGEIVIMGAEPVGSARYSELRAAAERAAEARLSSSSSSFPSSPVFDQPIASSSSSPSRLDRASLDQLDLETARAGPQSTTPRRHSSPDPQLANLVAASPELAFASDNVFLPFEAEPPLLPVNPSPARTSTRLPSGHPAAYHSSRFATPRRSPTLASARRPRLSEFGRTSSYTSAHRSSAYTTGSRHSVISEVESTSSALQATVQQGFRTSRAGSVAIPTSELVFGDSRRPSQASALSFPRSDSPGCARTAEGRQLSITSTFFVDSPSSPESTPPPVPLARTDFDFRGYSVTASGDGRRPSQIQATGVPHSERRPSSGRRGSRPDSLSLDSCGARSSTPNSLPPLTSSNSFSSRSSIDPVPSLRVPVRPHGRLSLEQPDAALLSLSTPLARASHNEPIDFGNFRLDPWNKSTALPSPTRDLPPASPLLGEAEDTPSTASKLNEYSWNRASAGDALTSRRPSMTFPQLEDRRETYPRSLPSRANNKQNVFDTLVQQAMYGNHEQQRKRGLSKEEVQIWLGDRAL